MWQRTPWAAYLTDRRITALTVARLGALALLFMLPVAVSVPGSLEAVPLLALWPAINATMVAMSLPEEMSWLYRGHPVRYRLLRLIAILIAEPVVISATLGATARADHGAAFLSVTLLAEGSVFLIAAIRRWLAWAPAMVVGLVAVVLPWPFIEISPAYPLLVPLSAATTAVGITVNVLTAARRPHDIAG